MVWLTQLSNYIRGTSGLILAAIGDYNQMFIRLPFRPWPDYIPIINLFIWQEYLNTCVIAIYKFHLIIFK